jgi:molybdopterin-guanine dinucleotide biosynthesis protein A
MICPGNRTVHERPDGEEKNVKGGSSDESGARPLRKTSMASAAILMGGEGSRMGFPKCLLRVGGRPLSLAAADILASLFGETFLVTDRRALPWELETSSRLTLLRDPIRGQGPLMGIIAALERCRFGRLFVMACDIPLIDLGLIESLLTVLPRGGCAVPRVGPGLLEPLFAVFCRGALDELREYFAAGGRKVQGAFPRLPTAYVDYAGSSGIPNLNTPDDLLRFEAERRGAGHAQAGVLPLSGASITSTGSPCIIGAFPGLVPSVELSMLADPAVSIPPGSSSNQIPSSREPRLA